MSFFHLELSKGQFPGIMKHMGDKTTAELAVRLSQPAEPDPGPKCHQGKKSAVSPNLTPQALPVG